VSQLEWIAAALGIVTVLLVVRRSIWNYPFALAMVSLYFFVFFEAKLYSDALLQIFFFAINCYGWWAWSRAPQVDDGVAVEGMEPRARTGWVVGTAVAALLLGTVMARFTDAAAPYPDAAIAAMSVSAQILQSLRRFESWIFWVVVDVLAIGVYASRGLYPTSALYAVFLILAVGGLLAWRRQLRLKAEFA
jgi:nicotinamide mononucleotide transporter